MKIILKKDWDISICPPILKSKEGHFVGRKKEISLLANELLRRKSGSILISGYRGVGKTSLVYKALSEVSDQNEKIKNNEKIVIILLNASQLEAEAESEKIKTDSKKINPENIIQNLIRRLYSTTIESNDINISADLKKQIKTIYRKAVATEFHLKDIYRNKQEISKELVVEEDREFLFGESNIRNIHS